MRKSAALLFVLLCASTASAGPRSIDDCEKIQDPMAYNSCLASFGPTPKSRGGGGGQVYPGIASEGEHEGRSGRVRATPHPRGARVIQRGPHGRFHMEFTPGRRSR
jgi:hypothetical protein